MGNVALVSRYLVYLPDSDESGGSGLARAKNAAIRAEFSVLCDDAYLLVTASASKGAALQRGGPLPRFLLDVFPGTASSPRMAALPQDAADRETLHRFAEQHAQSYNLLQLTDATFALEGDALGFKPAFLAQAPGGTVIASRIADILALFPALADPTDTVALYELMAFRTPIARRTLHRRIRRVLPGGCYHWRRNTALAVSQARRIQPAAVDPLLFMDLAIQRIRDRSMASLKEQTEHAGDTIALALSGGFDSRLMAAMCREQGIRVRALSYGRRQNEERHSARAVARALRLELETIDYHPNNSLHHLDHHLEILEGTADLSTSSVMNLLQVDTAPGTPLLHGYGGDVLAGYFLSSLGAAEYASHEALVDGVLHHYKAAARSETRRMLTPAVDPEEVRRDIVCDLRDDCPPHQAFTLWQFETRLRTYVGSYFPLIGGHFDTIMPFYDRRLFEIWTSIPPIGLADRAVFRKLLIQYYPALARIPHSEESAPIIPNLRSQLARFCRGLPRRVLDLPLGAERAKEVFLRSYRHDYIWNLGNLAAPQQRAYMLSRVTDLQPVLKEVLGVELASGYQSILAGDVQALRGMFLAAEYAQRRAARAAKA